MNIVVDIAAMAVSSNSEETLITYSLGSCIGVAMYDPAIHIGGMIHCMLPLSSVDSQKAEEKPCMFVDKGIALLLTRLFEMGARKNSLIVKIAGGSSMLDRKGLFRIGERNYTVFRKIMWKNAMMIAAEHVGGEISRTIRLNIATGRFTVKFEGLEIEI